MDSSPNVEFSVSGLHTPAPFIAMLGFAAFDLLPFPESGRAQRMQPQEASTFTSGYPNNFRMK